MSAAHQACIARCAQRDDACMLEATTAHQLQACDVETSHCAESCPP